MAITKEELIDGIKEMSVLDLAEVVKALEEEFGVSAAAPVAVAAAPAAGGDGGGAAAEEKTEFNVVLPSRENADPSPDPQALAALSKVTGGRCVDLEGLGGLLEEFPGGEERREPISSQLEDAWDHWGTLLLALALLSAEWILRKRFELI